MMYNVTKEVSEVYRTNVYLDEEQVRALKHMAAEQRCSLAELVRRAIDTYISTQEPDQALWRERLEDFKARVLKRQRRNVPSESVEADIVVAREEVRKVHRASSRR
ncbi:MAG: ribbon-helix-helix protein, CopG family [Chloroflexi bacterium]|nr:ribbon-helix-helix protein, CopG family [Chloroflexota bacterium]